MTTVHLKRLSVLLVCLAALPLSAQAPPPKGERATVIRETNLYVTAAVDSDRVGRMTPGREMVIIERTGKWLRVFANTDVEEAHTADEPVFGQESAPPPISGWMEDKGAISEQTPKGDQILMGEAASNELAASEAHAPHGAALAARLLYKRMADLFPQSPLAPEGTWRSADIRWQLQKADAMSRPSAHEKANYMREQMDEDELKKIEKKYPHTRWADLAAFNILDNKLCGDWQGSTKCPEHETEYYEKYAQEHPESPKAAEALYAALFRQASLVDMYSANDEGKRADSARTHARDLNSKLASRWGQTDYAARATALVYKLDQGIPIYGIDRE